MTTSPRPLPGRGLVVLLAVVGILLLPVPAASAHDMPDEFVLDTFVNPDGDRLHVLVRAPLSMLLDMRLPKRGPGYIDLAADELAVRLDASAVALAEQFGLYENGRRLTLAEHRSRLSVPADRAFTSFEEAVAHVAGRPLPPETNLFWNQGWFDAHFSYAIDAADSRFALQMGTDPGIARRLHVLVTFSPPDGRELAYDILGDAGRVALDPRWHEAAWLFAKAGFQRLLTGWEQLVFLALLVLPFRRSLRGAGSVLAAVVTTFAVAGLPAVAAAVAEVQWWAAVADTTVAVSILALAIGNLASRTLRWRWAVAGVLGLAHGAALSTGLEPVLQFGGAAMGVSLTAFVAGIGLATVVASAGLLALLRVVFVHPGVARHGVLVASLLAGHQAWHWIVERVDLLRALPAPHVDVLGGARRAVIVLLAAAAAWLTYELAAGRQRTQSDPDVRRDIDQGAVDA